MNLVPHTFALLCNSDGATGAKNKSDDGSEFTVQLNRPIQIPAAAVSCTVEVQSASIWNSALNISADIGNNILTLNTLTMTIDDGQYSIALLQAAIARWLATQGLERTRIVLSGDYATQKVNITFEVASDSLDFTVANSVNGILGFDARVVQGSEIVATGDNNAAFNRINSFLIQSDLISGGIPVNNDSNGILANVQIDQPPGSQVNYAPRHPTKCDATELVGQYKNAFVVRLRDQLVRPVDTNGENFTCLLVFKYFLPHKFS